MFLLRPYLSLSIIIKETEGTDMDFMRSMVTDANEMIIESELQLSDEVYRYDRDTQTLSLVKTAQPEEEIGTVPDEGMCQGMVQ